MTCRNQEAKAALRALFLGELEAQGHARLREHVGTCAECRDVYERLSRVESSLEKRVLPKGREALLEAQLLERVGVAARAAAPERRSFWDWWKVGLPVVAVAAVAMLVVLPRVRGQGSADGEWQARKGSGESAFGMRAFCVSKREVLGEAQPGGKLACPEGASVQFSYTAPEGAQLSVAGQSPTGEVLQFFPLEGKVEAVTPGVDVPLAYSTPVRGGWLSAPVEVRAIFTDEKGRVLGETQVTLTPAK